MGDSHWNQIKDLGAPWVPRLNALVTAARLPALRGSTLYIASDFGGYHRGSEYEVISFLMVDLDRCALWERNRRVVRQQFLPDRRRMAFKGLNDRYRLRALVPFLQSANALDGICVNIAVRKGIARRYVDNKRLALLRGGSPLTAKWSSKSLNRMFRIAHFVGLFIAGLSKPGQNIYWISDEDDIFANQARAQDVAGLLSALTSMYVDHELGELGIGTTSLDEGDRLEEDFAAIADLCAGALSEFLTAACRRCGGRIAGGLVYEIPRDLTPKTETIISWIADNSGTLKRLVLLFESAGDKLFGITSLQLE